MEAGRHREGELSGEAAHDPPCQSSTRRRAVAQRGRAVRARPDSGARPEGVGRQGPAENPQTGHEFSGEGADIIRQCDGLPLPHVIRQPFVVVGLFELSKGVLMLHHIAS